MTLSQEGVHRLVAVEVQGPQACCGSPKCCPGGEGLPRPLPLSLVSGLPSELTASSLSLTKTERLPLRANPELWPSPHHTVQRPGCASQPRPLPGLAVSAGLGREGPEGAWELRGGGRACGACCCLHCQHGPPLLPGGARPA